MVSLGSAGSNFFEQEYSQDAELLTDVGFANYDDGNAFRSIPTTWAIILQMVFMIIFMCLTWFLPANNERSSLVSSYMAILIYSHIVLWFFLLLIERYLHYQHRKFRRKGYLNFYQRVLGFKRLPILIFSLGNAVILIVITLLDEYCTRLDCHFPLNLNPYNYIQIINTVEVIITFPFLLIFLVKTIKFNRAAVSPDVEHDEITVSYMQGQVPNSDVGFRDENRMEVIIEKQADLICYLRQHTGILGRKIIQLTAELQELKSQQ